MHDRHNTFKMSQMTLLPSPHPSRYFLLKPPQYQIPIRHIKAREGYIRNYIILLLQLLRIHVVFPSTVNQNTDSH